MLEIWTECLPEGWKWSYDDYLGGTPEFVVNTANSARFEDVRVYYDGKSGEHNGVYYLPRDSFEGEDVVLACNDVPPKMGRYNIMWSNWYHKRDKDYLEFDERIVQSPYHQEIFGSDSRLVPLSIHHDLFKGGNKDPQKCLYSSSPDRGLLFLKSIWPEVRERTGAYLVSTYTKAISEEEMIEHYKTSKFWLHPGQGIELFCISAAKAQASGCIPVVIPNMALQTTVKYGIKTSVERYKEDLIRAIQNPPEPEEVDFGDWDSVTKELFKNV